MTVKIGDDFQKLTKYYRGKIGGYLDWSTKPKIYKQYPNSKKIELTIPDQIKLLPLDEAIKNRKSIRNYSKKPISLDQVVIGSCTNGRMEDLRMAAHILEGNRVAKDVRVIIIPGTQKIYIQASEEGLIKTFILAGAIVSTPTCGPCLGGHMGVLAKGERAISTTNRNFVGRMGHPESEVYLASPAVAAASALTGKISNPEELRSNI